ncbi:DUF7547 family protein [Halorubrum ezzemoulense]|uniref:Uncharacterized protein n=1 Tax=Halorubrum ezzemoulense TaxID=337243 RepID=A0A256K4I8_HALEZ|nr:hypothetical protein [Halorubrum ezzemoulense]OYR75377.1 hypothetical protein DJ76_03090 [Halorubrum ezzemoulense]
MSSRDRRDDDLEERLDELEDVLGELRADLRESERDRRGPPRPPRLSELVRFTEQYTIPTVIALLETTIKSLELLRGTLRLADPGRSVAEGAEGAGDRLADVRDGATAGLSRSLSELRTALSEADLPEDAASRAARDRRLGGDPDGDRNARSRGDAEERSDRGGGANPVRIDVTEPGESDDASDEAPGEGDASGDAADEPPEVDVESELESIKQQVDGDAAETSGDAADASDDAPGADDEDAAGGAN